MTWHNVRRMLAQFQVTSHRNYDTRRGLRAKAHSQACPRRRSQTYIWIRVYSGGVIVFRPRREVSHTWPGRVSGPGLLRSHCPCSDTIQHRENLRPPETANPPSFCWIRSVRSWLPWWWKSAWIKASEVRTCGLKWGCVGGVKNEWMNAGECSAVE